jgi:recombination protein RecA
VFLRENAQTAYEIEDKIRAAHGLDFDAPPPVSEEDVVEK